MNSNTKKLIILVVVLVGASIFMSAVCGISSFGLFRNRAVKIGEQSFSVKGNFSDIEINTKISDIRFYPSEGRSAKVIWNGPKTLKLSVRTSGNTLKIIEKNRLPWFLRFGINIGEAKLDVYLPKGSYDSLNIESDTGSVSVPTGYTFTNAEIESDTGAVEFYGKVQKDLKIETDTGRITAQDQRLEKLKINSDTGSITISNITASQDVDLESDTGRFILTDVAGKDLKIEGDTGSISLTNVIASASLKAESDTGSITLDRCDAGSLDLKSDTGSIRGTLLTGKVFDTKSGTGRVSVPETTTGGTCRIRTSTGSIEITIIGR